MRRLLLLLLLLPTAPALQASTINVASVNLGGSQWESTYLVSGRSFSVDEVLTIYFSYSLYANLTNTTPAGSDWNYLVWQPDTSFPSPLDGAFNAIAAVDLPTIVPFTVSYSFLGSGTPNGIQDFEVYAPDFTLLESGQTEPVPEPSTLALAGIALAAGYLTQRRRRAKHAT